MRKLGDDFPAEEEEVVVEEEEDEVSFRHITLQSLRESRWTSQGGVRISSALRGSGTDTLLNCSESFSCTFST